MWTAIIPLWARIAIIVGALGSIWVLGDIHGHTAEAEKKDLVIANNQHAYDARIKAADDALQAANARTRDLEQHAQAEVQAGITSYRKDRDAQQKVLQDRITALASGRERMRVDAVCRPADAGGGGAVPGAPAAASGSDAGAGGAELSPGAAARLAAVAGRADEVTRQLLLAQDTIRAYLKACGPQPAASPPPDPAVTKRSTFQLGLPDPFHH